MGHRLLLMRANTALVLMDVQEKLAAVMAQREAVVARMGLLVELVKLFGLPVIVTEQYPQGLGRTLPELAHRLPSYKPIEKLHFNGCKVDAFVQTLRRASVKRIILAGMEAHVCVLQTSLDLVYRGYEVHVPADAVCSRNLQDWQVALRLMERGGVAITTVETVIFQLLGQAGTPEFKKMLRLLKEAPSAEILELFPRQQRLGL